MGKHNPDTRREDNEKRLWEIFERIKEEKRPTGPTAFSIEAGIDRTYLYSFSMLAAEVSAYGRETQPHISRRGAGVAKAGAKKREIEDRVRREHTQWAKEVPELKQELLEAQQVIQQREEQIDSLQDRLQRVMRVFELLLMIAYEAGASPSELENLQQKAA
jgi:septin family protein